MGNYKFRFSDMIPNAWFHKLKNMNNKPTPNYYPKTLNHSKKKPVPAPVPVNPDPQFTNSDQRKSYYFTRDLTLHPPPAPPRSSSRRRRSAKRNRPALSASTVCSCGAVVRAKPEESSSAEECTNSGPDQTSSSEPDSVLTEFGSDRGSGHDVDIGMTSWPSPSPCKCRGTNDIVINIIGGGGGEGGEDQCRRRLPPIITKKEDFVTAGSPVRRLPAGVRLRVNSPRIGSRRGQGRRSVSSNSSSAASTRRSISESMAVVKASRDPRRDFRESMVEMIMENNIRASNDLEELLACYLSLNSDEYHELIINVFKQIWFDFIHLRLK